MAVGVAGHFDFVAGEVEVGEHTIVGIAGIIERELVDISGGSSL